MWTFKKIKKKIKKIVKNKKKIVAVTVYGRQ